MADLYLQIRVTSSTDCTVKLTVDDVSEYSVQSGNFYSMGLDIGQYFVLNTTPSSGAGEFSEYFCGIYTTDTAEADASYGFVKALNDQLADYQWTHASNPSATTYVSWLLAQGNGGRYAYVAIIPRLESPIDPWDWSAEVQAALDDNDSFEILTANEWNDFLDKVEEVMTAAGVVWDSSSDFSSYDEEIEVDVPLANMRVSSGDVFTAAMYNTLIWNISRTYYAKTGNWYYANADLRKTGDVVEASYFNRLKTAINACIDVL